MMAKWLMSLVLILYLSMLPLGKARDCRKENWPCENVWWKYCLSSRCCEGLTCTIVEDKDLDPFRIEYEYSGYPKPWPTKYCVKNPISSDEG